MLVVLFCLFSRMIKTFLNNSDIIDVFLGDSIIDVCYVYMKKHNLGLVPHFDFNHPENLCLVWSNLWQLKGGQEEI